MSWFSKVIEDPRAFASVTTLDLDFFELDLSNEGIGVLPDVIHIAFGNAGNDENTLVIGAAPYATENVSHLYLNDRWREFWTITVDSGSSYDGAMIPIRARFRLSGTGDSLQFVQQITDQSFLEGQTIVPLILPEATGGDPPISYSLMPGLPAGLSFESSTRTIHGTPVEITAAPVAYTYTATDASGNIASLRFTIEINPVYRLMWKSWTFCTTVEKRSRQPTAQIYSQRYRLNRECLLGSSLRGLRETIERCGLIVSG